MTIWTSVLWKKKIHMAKTEFRLKIKICSLSCVLRVIYNNFLVSNIFFFKFQMGRQVGAAATWTAEWMAEFTRMFSRNNAMPNFNWKILSNVFFNKKKTVRRVKWHKANFSEKKRNSTHPATFQKGLFLKLTKKISNLKY